MTKINKNIELGQFEFEDGFGGFDHDWGENSYVYISCHEKERLTSIVANRGGVRALGELFLSFAEDNVPTNGWHMHIYEDKDYWRGDLQKGSNDLVISKINETTIKELSKKTNR